MAKLIALSAGGDNTELARQGLGIEHVDELLVRMSRRLLQDGHRLSFGGTLGQPDEKLTQLLINSAMGWINEDSAGGADVNDTATWPLTNYGAWPYYTFLTPEQEASLVGVCNFVPVLPPERSAVELRPLLKEWKTNIDARRHTANALSEMRKLSTSDADMRIVWGGKISGAAGWMAGIAEELLCSLEQEVPTIILGGFGGCAQLIAEYLSSKKEEWPEQLTFTYCCESPDYLALVEDQNKEALKNQYDRLIENCSVLRDQLRSGNSISGVPNELFLEALQEQSARVAIRIAGTAANSLDTPS